jgi:hypothetical protein
MQNVDWNSQGSIVGQLEDYGSRVLEGGQLMIVSCTNSQKYMIYQGPILAFLCCRTSRYNSKLLEIVTGLRNLMLL